MPQNITTSAKALVEAAEREIETLSIEDAIKLHGRDDTVLVDIRDIRELQREGKVPGAFHCPRGMHPVVEGFRQHPGPGENAEQRQQKSKHHAGARHVQSATDQIAGNNETNEP